MKLSTAVGDDGGGVCCCRSTAVRDGLLINSGPLNKSACIPTMMNSSGDNNILHFIAVLISVTVIRPFQRLLTLLNIDKQSVSDSSTVLVVDTILKSVSLYIAQLSCQRR